MRADPGDLYTNMNQPGTATDEDMDADARALIYIRVSSAQQANTDYDLEGFSFPRG